MIRCSSNFLKIILASNTKLQHNNTDMSTDFNETPLTKAYDVIEHRNSNHSRRNGTAAASHRKGLNHFTYQVIRHPGGMPLPHIPARVKPSKYSPHVGAKQLAKLS
jgi:hypothetical protein